MTCDDAVAIDTLAELIELPEYEQHQALSKLTEDGTSQAARVLRMWKALELNRRDQFLEWSPSPADGDSRDARKMPSRVGPYSIVSELGSGGACSVYLASQTSPIQRMCALKVLQVGLSTTDAQRRFVAERETVGSLRHPNIAQLFDAGVGDHGELYFAMEYVEGLSITQFGRKTELSQTDRIRLFLQVCDAVAYAHRQGLLHRDLKPSNILVTDACTPAPHAKVIDFGIAKVMKSAPSHELTQPGLLVGTLAYMSPEQLHGDPRAVDTRSDVFALGLVLFELLTGDQPFDSDGTLSSLPGMNQAFLAKTINGNSVLSPDIKAVVGKATSHDVEQRYESVSALAADLNRVLSQRPVEARAATPWYLTMRFVSRHRAATAASALVLAVVIVAMVGVSRARQERANLAVGLANAWLTEALSMGRQLGDKADREPVLRRLLDEATRLQSVLPNDAQVQTMLAATHTELGYALLAKNVPREAIIHFQHALAIREAIAAADSSDLTKAGEVSLALVRLGDATMGIGETESGMRLYRQALTIDEALVQRNGLDPTLLSNLGWSYERLASWSESHRVKEALSERQLQAFSTRLTVRRDIDSLRGLSSAYHNLAQAKRDQGKPFAYEASRALEYAEAASVDCPDDRILVCARIRARVVVAESQPTLIDRCVSMNKVLEDVEAMAAANPSDRDARDLLVGVLYRCTLIVPAGAADPTCEQARKRFRARFDAVR